VSNAHCELWERRGDIRATAECWSPLGLRPAINNRMEEKPDRAGAWTTVAADLLSVVLPLALLDLRTAARDLGTIDCGELAAVCTRLGIAHPTGYPLYTLLGRLAVLAFPVPPIRALVLLSVLIAVAAGLAATWLAQEVLDRLGAGPGRPGPRRDPGRPNLLSDAASPSLLSAAARKWLARGAGLLFATSSIFWNQATGNEVYGLHLLFVILLLRQGLRLLAPRGDARPAARELLLTAWMLGLAFSHHLSVVFVLPAMFFALIVFLRAPGLDRDQLGRSEGRGRLRLLLPAALTALLAWSIELYLPIRASRSPLLDWGSPDHWASFWRHAMAAQYRVWLFESGRLWIRNLGGYLISLPHRLIWPVLLASPVGFVVVFRRDRRAFWFLALVLLVTLAWASSYDIHDLDPYYLPADLVLVLYATAGFSWLLARAGWRRFAPARPGAVGAALFLLLPALQAGFHFRHADQSGDHFVRVHAEEVLRDLPERSILISMHWDALVSPLLYMQGVEGTRRDLTVVDTELMRRTWYFPQLRRWDPTLLAPCEEKVSSFLQQLKLFESGRPYDQTVIESRYRAVIQAIALAHRPRRLTAFTPEEEPSFAGGTFAIPEGLVFVLRDRPEDSPPLAPPDTRRLLQAGYHPEDAIHRQIAESWSHMIGARIRYLTDMKRMSEIPAWEAAARDVKELLDRH
jgi:hypothetical protein